MSSRAAAALWLVLLTVVVASLWWIDRREGWDAVFAPAAAPESNGREHNATSVFTFDCTEDGETVLGLRGHPQGAPLLIIGADGHRRRIPSAEAFIGQSVIWSAALFPDGTSLLVAVEPAGVARVDLSSGKVSPLLTNVVLASPPRLAISANGGTVAVALPGEMLLLDAADGTVRARLPAAGAVVAAVVFSPDGQLLAIGRTDGEIQLWDVATGARLRGWPGHAQGTWRLRFVGDGSRLASVGCDGAFRLWETETGRELWSDPGDGNGLRALAIAPDGSTAAAGGVSADIHIWDLDTGRRKQTLKGHTQPISALQFIRAGTVLVSASFDGTLCYWDAAGDSTCLGWEELGGSP
jgi:hypothetical protein